MQQEYFSLLLSINRNRKFSLAVLLLAAVLLVVVVDGAAATIGDACTKDADCGGSGLGCSACGQRSVCTQIQPTDPKTMGRGLAFNKYSWLTTHNSFAQTGAKSATGALLVSPTNQLDTVTAQLKNGVRGLMLDMYDFQNDVWLCHSFGGNCYNFTAFQPAVNVLKEVKSFLDANPSEVVTIFIEDYVKAPDGMGKAFNASGLAKYWFPVSQMPKNGGDWPLLSDMISKDQRLLVFTSKSAKEASEGIAYEWNYVVENQYGDDGMKAGSCPNRAESPAMSTKSKSLVLMNYFPTNPNVTAACRDNSAPLASMLTTCHGASADRWPNFVAVDFYTKGGAPKAADIANGHMVCGCDDIAYCKANATFGTCDVPPAEAAPAKAPSTSSTTNNATKPTPTASGTATSIPRSAAGCWLLIEMALSVMLLSL
ncbi:MAP3K-like protein kinase precursor [Iris pallida]|uniref:MAP3K-like protein kinase n=1 Tax=Iris pallida TaxID=29817 RepID=A0AAX6E2X3_IRIPA|nr:MAP3K-like protein kinase precursor [Iris pallida]